MRVCLSWSIFFAAWTPISPPPARVHQLAEVSVLEPDLCTRLCHLAGRELEPIQFLLGTPRFRQLSAISAASRNSAKRCTTTSDWKTRDGVVTPHKRTSGPE